MSDAFDLEIPRALVRRLEGIDAELDRHTGTPRGLGRPIDLQLVPARIELRSRPGSARPPSSTRPAIIAASLLIGLLATVTLLTMPDARIGGSAMPSLPLGSVPVVAPSIPAPSTAPSAAVSGPPRPSTKPIPSGRVTV